MNRNTLYILTTIMLLLLTSTVLGCKQSPTPVETPTPLPLRTLTVSSSPSAIPTLEASPLPSVTPPKTSTGIPSLTPTASTTPEQSEAISSNRLLAELIFTAPGTVLAIAGDHQGAIFLRTEPGEIWKLTSDGISEKVYSGLSHCSFSQAVMAALPDGVIITNDCVDNQDVLLQIDSQGVATSLLQLGFDQSIVSIASDIDGNIYLGSWLSEGNISLNFDPTHLGAADYIFGRVSILSSDSQLDPLFEGGIPLALRVTDDGKLFASIWGESGPFRPASGDYSICASDTLFWVGLSDQVSVQQLFGENAGEVVTDQLRAVSSMDIDTDGQMFALGLNEEGNCGIHSLQSGGSPNQLVFSEDEIDRYAVGLFISDPDIYFATEDGNVYRVADFTTTYVPESSAASASVQTPIPTPKEVVITEIIDQSNDVSAAHIDVVKLSYEIVGETLQAVFHLSDVPAELTFNRSGVPGDSAEYIWQIFVDIDNDRETGEQLVAIGSDYTISVLYFARLSASEVTASIGDVIQANVWKYDPTDGGWSVVAPATIVVDPEADTITLTGEIPGLAAESKITFYTYDYKAGEDKQ